MDAGLAKTPAWKPEAGMLRAGRRFPVLAEEFSYTKIATKPLALFHAWNAIMWGVE